jgi:hyperosmotically inducible protein
MPEAVAQDLIITTAVKTALLNDREVNGVRIDVETVRGVVTLSGVVSTEAGGRRAIELARAVNGVVEVKSRLRVERSLTSRMEIDETSDQADRRLLRP